MVKVTVVVKGKKLKYGYKDDNVIVLNGGIDKLFFIFSTRDPVCKVVE